MSNCRALGYEYAGIQKAEECWCGYGSHNQIGIVSHTLFDINYSLQLVGTSSTCTLRCTGDPTLLCGGKKANSVYLTRCNNKRSSESAIMPAISPCKYVIF